MKKLLLLSAIAILGFARCKKDNPKPASGQLVSYDVEALYALAYVKDNIWNGENSQHFNVGGKWHYEFENTDLDTAFLAIYYGTFDPSQHIKATISVNGKVVKTFERDYKVAQDWGITDTLTYKLR